MTEPGNLDVRIRAEYSGPSDDDGVTSPNWRRCSSAKCDDVFYDARRRYTLCPSCRYIGQVGFYMGALLAGCGYGLWRLVEWGFSVAGAR